jgi:hypothetical protein
MRRASALFLAVLLLVPAGARSSGGGSSGAEFLRVAMGARPAALGENFTGLADDVNAATWNPAGLGQLKNMQFSAMHLKYVEDINFEYLAASMPFGEWGSAAVSGVYMSMPPFDSTGVAGAAKGTASDAALALSWGGSFGPLSPDSAEFQNVYYGLTGKMIYRTLGGYSPTGGEGQTFTAVAGAVDIGAYWAYTPELTFGAVVQNIGSTITFLGDESDALPFGIRGGMAWRGYDEDWLRATLLADAVKPYDPDGGKPGNVWGGVGTEFLIVRMLALRAGFRMGPEGSSVVGGAGLVIGPVSADYAFTPMSGFDSTHRMSLTVKLGEPEARRLPATAKISGKAMPKKRIDIIWEAVKGAAGYFVEVRKGDSAFKRVTPKPREKTSIPFKGLKAGSRYTFRVIPVDDRGREGRANELVVNLKGKARTAAGAAPAGVPARLAAAVEGRQVALSWQPVPGSSGYHVYYRKAGGQWKKATAAAARRTTRLVLKGLAPQTYEFSVSAVDAAGKEGPQSAPVPVQVAP